MARGEEVVTVVVVLRVVVALASAHLYYEAFWFIALAVAALSVEAVLEGKKVEQLNLRPGASAGILLGSVTWPLVLASRLQLQSNLSVPSDRPAFWISILCGFRLLSMMYYISMKQNKTSLFVKLEECVLSCRLLNSNLAIFSALCMLLAWLTGFQDMINVAVRVFQVFGSGILLLKIFQEFPACVTLGEALLLAIGFSVYGGNVVLHALPTKSKHHVGAMDAVDIMLQVAVLGLSLMPSTYKACLQSTRNSKGISFVVAIFFIVMIVAPAWFYFVLGLQQHPVLWVADFMIKEPLTLVMCMYWVVILCILPCLYKVAKHSWIPQILVRKLYHVMAVVMFVPALLIQAEFLRLAFIVALVVFVLVEMLRIWQVPPLAPIVKDYMIVFTDNRDSDRLIISHFSLLLGCALPVWLHAHTETRPLAPFAGILSIGIGDTMASYVGYNYGSWRLSRTNKKTVEGTTAGIFSLVVSCFLLLQFLPKTCFTSAQVSVLTIAAVCAGLVEAYTSQLDNVFVPLVFYALLCI